MRKWSKKEFSVIAANPEHKNWEKFNEDHGFIDWGEFGTSINDIVGEWEGMLPYDVYEQWFDIYNSSLYKLMQENS